MNHTLLASCLLAILPLSPVERIWGQAPTLSDPHRQETPDIVHQRTKLPFRLYWGYLAIVQGSIGQFQKLNFLVDTGTYPSVVDQEIVRSLKLTGQPARVNLSNKSVPTQLVILPSLLLGPVRVQSLPVLTQDLSRYQKALGCKVNAIVGLDVLRAINFTIDYKLKELRFGPIESLPFSAPFDTDEPVVTIRVQLQKHQLRVVVDSGGPDLMLFRSRVSDAISFEALGTEEVADAIGSFQRRRVRIPELNLGDEKIGPQIAFVADDRKDEGDNFDGVLGVRGPKFLEIAFDFEHRTFWWDQERGPIRK
jgi:Aspartyl protease